MGSPVSAVVTNLYMKFFEMGFKEELLCYLDRARLTIRFTMEQEEIYFHFFDTLLMQKEKLALCHDRARGIVITHHTAA